ncbi:MAG: hypothetical protein KGH93_00355 [Patescibacteria group bacterium]|nr:hypothetical protein [Patescibacteria group bacterium]MDE1945642.1 hypothetical protein [Patescibacteria group bacterium]
MEGANYEKTKISKTDEILAIHRDILDLKTKQPENAEKIQELTGEREAKIQELADSLTDADAAKFADYFKKNYPDHVGPDFDERKKQYAALALIAITNEGNALFGI